MSHHIRLRNIFLSLALLMVPAVSMSVARPFLSNTDSYIYMNWNLFLGLIPLIAAILYYRKVGGRTLLPLWFIVWLSFLPNAPYMITDFIHMADVGPRSILWYDGLMLFGYAWGGMISWLYSMVLMYQRFPYRSFIPIVSLLTAFGLYLGRYIRFNTWDLLQKPGDITDTIAQTIIQPLSNEPFLLFVGVFWVFLMVSYYSYIHVYRFNINSSEA